MVAVPFFALMMAILENGLLFFASQTIENAVAEAGRLVRTGQAQTQGLDEDSFRTEICQSMGFVFDCENDLRIDVRTYEDFSSIDLAQPIDEDGNLIEDFEYSPGDAGDIVVVRAFYEWPIYVNLLGAGLANLSNGSYLIAASTAFRNEPF